MNNNNFSFVCFLVLDEADRILDLGFSQTMNAIIENLPETRQTLLFSATQTKYVIYSNVFYNYSVSLICVQGSEIMFGDVR